MMTSVITSYLALALLEYYIDMLLGKRAAVISLVS